MAARKKAIFHDQDTRNKIQAAQLINRMVKCVNGEVEMTNTQVSCAKALLNKVLPDLQAVQLEADVTHEAGDSLLSLMGQVDGATRSK
jgi:hypothetical protein